MQQAAELSVPAPTIEAALDGRFLSGLKDERVKAAQFYSGYGVQAPQAPEVCIFLRHAYLGLPVGCGHALHWQVSHSDSLCS